MSKLYHIKERTLDVQNQDGRLLLKLLETQKFYAAGLLLNQWKPINLTYTDSNGNTALHLAVSANIKCTRHLHEKCTKKKDTKLKV